MKLKTGPKPIFYSGERPTRSMVMLTEGQKAKLKKIGDGNISEGIRRLLGEKGEQE